MDLIKHFWYLIHVERQRNSHCISVYITDDAIENDQNTVCFNYFKTIQHLFWTLILQEKYNIRTLWFYIKLICTCFETGQKTLLFLKQVQISFIFSDNVYCIYIAPCQNSRFKSSNKIYKTIVLFINFCFEIINICIFSRQMIW